MWSVVVTAPPVILFAALPTVSTSLALEVPIACLTNGTEPVIGGWTTAAEALAAGERGERLLVRPTTRPRGG